MSEKKVRVRFAPSPTGPLHIGGIRTALYNYLFARKHDGDFILRIEDTDSNRFVPGAEDYIIKSLEWCGIKFDEGVHLGGPHAPYRQSERKALYFQYAQQLIKSGNAYIAFDTPEELDTLRKEYEAQKKTFIYNYEIRNQLNTSIKLGEAKTQELIAQGKPWVVRFFIPENEEIHMHDIIRGEVVVNSSTLDDKVLYKSHDGLPTYHLANIVDDYLMQISHVIRGEEWLPSLPLHVLLYRTLGWESAMPKFAHLPLLLKPDGKGKLSKRDGDKLGFPVFPLKWIDPANGEVSSGYREFGFIPEAFANFLAMLGWNPGTEQEIFSIDQLAQAFSLDRCSKAGAKFDFEKATWFNHQYLQKQLDEDIAEMFKPILTEHGIKANNELVVRLCGLLKPRANFPKDLWEQGSFFFEAPKSYDPEVIKKRWKPEIPSVLHSIVAEIDNICDFTAPTINDVLHHYIESQQLNMGQVMNCLRLALVGASKGPDLPVIIEILGKDEVIGRIRKALETIQTN